MVGRPDDPHPGATPQPASHRRGTVLAQVDQVVTRPRLTQDMVDKGDVRRRHVVDRGAAGLDLPAGEDLAVVEGDADGDIAVAVLAPQPSSGELAFDSVVAGLVVGEGDQQAGDGGGVRVGGAVDDAVPGAPPPAVDDRGDVPVADVVRVPVGAVGVVEAEQGVRVLHRVVVADRRGTGGDAADQVVHRSGVGDDGALLGRRQLGVPAELGERVAAPVDRRQVRRQLLAPVRRDVGDVSPELVELDRAQLEHVGAEEADLVVIGTATVELAHPADQLQHGLGAEHEQGVAHDGRRVAMTAGDVPVDRDPAAPAFLPGDGAEPQVLDQVPGHPVLEPRLGVGAVGGLPQPHDRGPVDHAAQVRQLPGGLLGVRAGHGNGVPVDLPHHAAARSGGQRGRRGHGEPADDARGEAQEPAPCQLRPGKAGALTAVVGHLPFLLRSKASGIRSAGPG